MENEALLDVIGLSTQFKTHEGVVRAVNDVTFSVGAGETLGVVGESGCGKSVTALSIMRLLPEPQGRIAAGTVRYRNNGDAVELSSLKADGQAIRSIRGKEIAMVFQEPMTSLNPLYTVGWQIREALELHLGMTQKAARERAVELLDQVGIPSPRRTVDAYPHELSGGMRQRAMIAMAISCNPKLLIADEPTTALDVTIQAQILELLRALQEEWGMAVMLITHDLGVICEMTERVIVMYAGSVVETASTDELIEHPLHPYTRALLRSVPSIDREDTLESIPGTVPRLTELPRGCPFVTRCSERFGRCHEENPELLAHSPSHQVRCWLYVED
jgi:peptide/nickel transport system ATP-binding protein/oligopeptide transport system ATP-binding protein